jgi:LysM domain
VVVPAAPVEPGIGREHRPADPAPPHGDPVARGVRQAPAATALSDPSRTDAAGSRSAADPVRTRPLGSRSAADEVRTRPLGSRSAADQVRTEPFRTRPLGTRPVARPVAQPVRTRPVGLRPAGARVVRPAPGHLRLTRRGRLVTAAATLLIAGLTLVGVVSRAGALHETAPLPASAPAQVVVAPGETLWSIAHRVAPDRDPRTVVAGIQRLNDLPTPDVRAGQTLLLRAP